jgi:hypothetical protein
MRNYGANGARIGVLDFEAVLVLIIPGLLLVAWLIDADAHYNVALALEKTKQPRKALHHWRAYVKLDSTGPWSTHARAQIAKIVKQENLAIVARQDK